MKLTLAFSFVFALFLSVEIQAQGQRLLLDPSPRGYYPINSTTHDGWHLMQWMSSHDAVLSQRQVSQIGEAIWKLRLELGSDEAGVLWLDSAIRISDHEISARDVLILTPHQIFRVRVIRTGYGEIGGELRYYYTQLNAKLLAIAAAGSVKEGASRTEDFTNELIEGLRMTPDPSDEVSIELLFEDGQSDFTKIARAIYEATRSYFKSSSLIFSKVPKSTLGPVLFQILDGKQIVEYQQLPLYTWASHWSNLANSTTQLLLPEAFTRSEFRRQARRLTFASLGDLKYLGTNLLIISACVGLLSQIPLGREKLELVGQDVSNLVTSIKSGSQRAYNWIDDQLAKISSKPTP